MKQSKTFIFLCFSIYLFLGGVACAENKEDDRYTAARKNMVEYQIRLRGIDDVNVLNAMKAVPRHEFVPDIDKRHAYEDRPLPIGYGQTISQPYIVALMTELLKPDANTRALEVGTGSGYQAAVLAKIAKEVFSVEIVKPLHDRSRQILKKLGYDNVKTIHKNGYNGWEEHGPFDAIVVTCASEFVPPPLIKQLKPGGRMCIPVGPPFKVQHLVLIEKGKDNSLTTTIIGSVRFVPLVRDR